MGLSILSYCKTEMMLVSPTPVSQVDVATAMILKIEALHKGPMRVLDEEFEGAGCCLVAVVVNLTLRPVVGVVAASEISSCCWLFQRCPLKSDDEAGWPCVKLVVPVIVVVC